MTILKSNGDIITCTVEEYKQIYKPTIETVNIPNVWFPNQPSVPNDWTITTSATLEDEQKTIMGIIIYETKI